MVPWFGLRGKFQLRNGKGNALRAEESGTCSTAVSVAECGEPSQSEHLRGARFEWGLCRSEPSLQISRGRRNPLSDERAMPNSTVTPTDTLNPKPDTNLHVKALRSFSVSKAWKEGSKAGTETC